ncbi:folylpolyglutamate synthase [Cladophialophora chaetospira]|uniref:Folylpolyglutamate synthase n=1 Tax=Cladophialophora chaetospira TaxID=386627 RepID=A0AA39CGF2_9EURO|nr:folylpolyglutamate synthase [Cladophialophora chaetospira]
MINLGLQRISLLLNPLFTAHPRLPWRAVHIAGTNGKGSVAALVSTFLGHLGYSVGRFTSPHLIDRWDCITINKNVVDRDKFLPVEQHFRDVSNDENIGASEFEILTATAFQLFTDEKVDVAVIECGLGGREDATNVLRSQDVILSVLTKVGLDHTEFLGDTIEAITAEKAGIFKSGVPVVVDQSNNMVVLEVVGKRLKELGQDEDEQKAVSSSREEEPLDFEMLKRRLRLGQYQVQNLYTAWSAFRRAEKALNILHAGRQPLPIRKTVRASLERLAVEAQSSLPGRLQWLTLPPPLVLPGLAPALHEADSNNRQPPSSMRVLLDGAHNVQSAKGLASFVNDNLRPQTSQLTADFSKPITWLVATKSDKDVDNILSILIKPHDNVVTCTFGPVDGMPWVKPMPTSALASKAEKLTDGTVRSVLDKDEMTKEPLSDVIVATALEEAIRIASLQGEGVRLCITGSLYLVGDILRCVRNAGGSIYGGAR